jgi:hypothetical protein
MALGLLGFGLADLVRWSPEPVSPRRAVIAIAAGAAGTVALAALGGASVAQALAVAAVSLAVLGVWIGCDYPLSTVRLSGIQLAWAGAVFIVLFAFSGAVNSISGPLEHWYEQLGFGFVESVAVDQFVLGVSATIFMTASGNRVVRLLLDQAGVSLRNESDVPGGRVLGPLERLIVFAIVLAGDPAAAAIVITGKGLLRFPEIRRDSETPGPDARTEYFLIGTFASLVIAAMLAALVLAAS